MKKLILTGLFGLLTTIFINAQNIVGKWKTVDDETGKPKSVVEIYKKGDKYYGKIVQLLIKPEKSTCEKCTDDRKNKALVGLEIIRNLKKDGEEYSSGTILDPKKGKIYTCKIWIDKDKPNILNVRGYVGVFFRTQKWSKM